MTFSVRSLLPKVQVFRTDLEKEKALYAIQETVRKICRTTEACNATVKVCCTANSPMVDLTAVMANYGTVFRVMLVRILDVNMINVNTIVQATSMMGTFLYTILDPGTTNFVLNGAIDNNPGTSFLSNGPGTGTGTVTTLAGNTLLGSYMLMGEGNQTLVDEVPGYRNYPIGFPAGWTYMGNNTLQIYPTPDKVYNLEVSTSFIPEGEFDTIPLPLEAEEAIVSGALSNLLMQPGPGQNLQLAKDRERRHSEELNFLHANAMLGQSGRPRAVGPSFGGRAHSLYATRWY